MPVTAPSVVWRASLARHRPAAWTEQAVCPEGIWTLSHPALTESHRNHCWIPFRKHFRTITPQASVWTPIPVSSPQIFSSWSHRLCHSFLMRKYPSSFSELTPLTHYLDSIFPAISKTSIHYILSISFVAFFNFHNEYFIFLPFVYKYTERPLSALTFKDHGNCHFCPIIRKSWGEKKPR